MTSVAILGHIHFAARTRTHRLNIEYVRGCIWYIFVLFWMGQKISTYAVVAPVMQWWTHYSHIEDARYIRISHNIIGLQNGLDGFCPCTNNESIKSLDINIILCHIHMHIRIWRPRPFAQPNHIICFVDSNKRNQIVYRQCWELFGHSCSSVNGD